MFCVTHGSAINSTWVASSPSPAKDTVAVIDDTGLTRRHPEHRLCQDQLGNSGAGNRQQRRHRRLGRTQLHGNGALDPWKDRRIEPVGRAESNYLPGEGTTRADDDLGALGVEANNEERLRLAADLETTALTDGEIDDAVMAADHLAVEIDDGAGSQRAGAQLGDEAAVIAIGHEADILAVGLGGDR